MRATRFASILGILVAARASAASFPARTGETGILDVPDAEVAGIGGGSLATEFRFDHTPGHRNDFGPLPLYFVAGVGESLEVGATMREWGQPDDVRPARLAIGSAAKLRLLKPSGPVPGAALSTYLDGVNGRTTLGSRLALSTTASVLKLAAFGGVESRNGGYRSYGATGGIAATVPLGREIELAAEALTGPRGPNVGGALRTELGRYGGFAVGANWFPDDRGYRIFVAFTIAPAAPKRLAPDALAPAVKPLEAPTPAVPAGPKFTDARPHFRLRMPTSSLLALGEPRRLQYGPFTGTGAGAGAGAAKPTTAAAPARAAAPSLEDLAEAQLKEQEALAEARARRVRATGDQLDEREKAALEEAKKLEQRERELAAREQQLDVREQRTSKGGPPTQQQRQLESLEAQLSAQERQLSAQERSLAPAIDAAQGRERDAAARDDAERQEATRLAASVSGAGSRALQIEIRKQALAARNRQLAALEARLVAKGERIDGLERQLRIKGERLDAWSRRLDARAERLDLLEKRAAEAARPKTAETKPAETKPTAAKDKAVFVMVVKSPTAIVKERTGTQVAPASEQALHPGVAVEKAVAAATVVTFPTLSSQLSELDRETIENIARLAAKERCELLIWARAKDPSLMAEAQRRAAEIRTRAIAAGPLDGKQVVTRITTRPGAQGVDVVISALRETTKAVAPAVPAPAGPALLPGESGKRQLREVVVAAQPSIEACVGEQIERKKLQRAEGTLKLTVSTRGKVTKVATGGGDLAGTEIEECLTNAAAAWAFPTAEGDYVVDVPITVIRGGSPR